MRTRQVLLATLATVLVLAGCGQEASVPGMDGSVPTEPPEASSKDFGDYVIHFNAISTELLQPDVARAYSITRSRNRAMLNVSIIRKVEGTLGVSVAGTIKCVTGSGDAASAILAAAEEEGADLIVMGSRGLGAFRSLLVGSVSQKVSHLADCSCITVK